MKTHAYMEHMNLQPYAYAMPEVQEPAAFEIELFTRLYMNFNDNNLERCIQTMNHICPNDVIFENPDKGDGAPISRYYDTPYDNTDYDMDLMSLAVFLSNYGAVTETIKRDKARVAAFYEKNIKDIDMNAIKAMTPIIEEGYKDAERNMPNDSFPISRWDYVYHTYMAKVAKHTGQDVDQLRKTLNDHSNWEMYKADYCSLYGKMPDIPEQSAK